MARTRSQPGGVEIWNADGLICAVSMAKLKKAALVWTYIAANRARWIQRGSDGQEGLVNKCVEQLAAFGIHDEQLGYLAANRVIEIRIPANPDDEAFNWAARVMPWEHLLFEAIRFHYGREPLVVRFVDCGRRDEREFVAAKSVTAVVGAIGLLDEYYSFDGEFRLPKQKLGLEPTRVVDPTRDELAEALSAAGSDVIHVGGVDTYQAVELDLIEVEKKRDGMLLRTSRETPEIIAAGDLAKLLVGRGAQPPTLVAFNLYRSGARMAPLTVAAGAALSIGFQNKIDDLAAETFLGEFYAMWQLEPNPLVALRAGLDAIRTATDAPETAVVLCSDRSLLGTPIAAVTAKVDARRGRRVTTSLAAMTLDDVRDAVDVEIHPIPRLNYANLHNLRPLFESFELRNRDENRRIDGVVVQVELFAGDEPLRFRQAYSVGSAPVQVDVRIPLTSRLARSLSESIQTTFHVRVDVGEHTVHDRTYAVTLLPINEWVDDDQDRKWLPSFAFPTDPAVSEILGSARKYLAYLADVTSQGFDGYQSLRTTPDGELDAEGVDQQVEAIWSALLHARNIAYTNPPPSYTESSQRLRTPTRVLAEGRGTCIDLALLLVSCLENVEIHPVMFLLEGHAFPGYWRSNEAREAFLDMKWVHKLSIQFLSRHLADQYLHQRDDPWMFGLAYYEQIKQEVQAGNLVPVESVMATSKSSFERALDVGWENLLVRSEFDSLVDVATARAAQVTPLPLHGGMV